MILSIAGRVFFLAPQSIAARLRRRHGHAHMGVGLREITPHPRGRRVKILGPGSGGCSAGRPDHASIDPAARPEGPSYAPTAGSSAVAPGTVEGGHRDRSRCWSGSPGWLRTRDCLPSDSWGGIEDFRISTSTAALPNPRLLQPYRFNARDLTLVIVFTLFARVAPSKPGRSPGIPAAREGRK